MAEKECQELCPLCVEPLDATDKAIRYCACGYRMCLWCWHQLMETASKENMQGKCPNCRTPYDKDKVSMSRVDADDGFVEEKKKSKKITEKKQRGPVAVGRSRKHLQDVRILQRNLVYAVGLSLSICKEEVLADTQYFGQYGKIKKISVNRSSPYSTGQSRNGPTGAAYVTFIDEDDATRCVTAIDGAVWDGRYIRACFGTTKYCQAFLKGAQCNNPDCLYMHEIVDSGTFTKEDMLSGFSDGKPDFYHLIYFDRTKGPVPGSLANRPPKGPGSNSARQTQNGKECTQNDNSQQNSGNVGTKKEQDWPQLSARSRQSMDTPRSERKSSLDIGPQEKSALVSRRSVDGSWVGTPPVNRSKSASTTPRPLNSASAPQTRPDTPKKTLAVLSSPVRVKMVTRAPPLVRDRASGPPTSSRQSTDSSRSTPHTESNTTANGDAPQNNAVESTGGGGTAAGTGAGTAGTGSGLVRRASVESNGSFASDGQGSHRSDGSGGTKKFGLAWRKSDAVKTKSDLTAGRESLKEEAKVDKPNLERHSTGSFTATAVKATPAAGRRKGPPPGFEHMMRKVSQPAADPVGSPETEAPPPRPPVEKADAAVQGDRIEDTGPVEVGLVQPARQFGMSPNNTDAAVGVVDLPQTSPISPIGGEVHTGGVQPRMQTIALHGMDPTAPSHIPPELLGMATQINNSSVVMSGPPHSSVQNNGQNGQFHGMGPFSNIPSPFMQNSAPGMAGVQVPLENPSAAISRFNQMQQTQMQQNPRQMPNTSMGGTMSTQLLQTLMSASSKGNQPGLLPLHPNPSLGGQPNQMPNNGLNGLNGTGITHNMLLGLVQNGQGPQNPPMQMGGMRNGGAPGNPNPNSLGLNPLKALLHQLQSGSALQQHLNQRASMERAAMGPTEPTNGVLNDPAILAFKKAGENPLNSGSGPVLGVPLPSSGPGVGSMFGQGMQQSGMPQNGMPQNGMQNGFLNGMMRPQLDQHRPGFQQEQFLSSLGLNEMAQRHHQQQAPPNLEVLSMGAQMGDPFGQAPGQHPALGLGGVHHLSEMDGPQQLGGVNGAMGGMAMLQNHMSAPGGPMVGGGGIQPLGGGLWGPSPSMGGALGSGVVGQFPGGLKALGP